MPGGSASFRTVPVNPDGIGPPRPAERSPAVPVPTSGSVHTRCKFAVREERCETGAPPTAHICQASVHCWLAPCMKQHLFLDRKSMPPASLVILRTRPGVDGVRWHNDLKGILLRRVAEFWSRE